MMQNLQGRDTIIALSSPPGVGALAVIRLSGPDSRDFTNFLLERSVPWQAGRLFYRKLYKPSADRHLIDDVVLSYYAAPHSYTGEDVVEISCHGNPRLVQEILQVYLGAGARLARPGEFTERALLNDKLSLTQAEGVLDVITASTDRGLAVAQAMKEGLLGRSLKGIRDQIVDILSHLEASLDFAEDGIEPQLGAPFFQRILDQKDAVHALIKTAPLGRILREGALVVIVGKPNVGKSSLLNAMLREDRAIVAPTPGTTRDLIEAECSVRGLPVRLVDTAGQRLAQDAVEAEGIRRAERKQGEADVVLWVVEAQEEFSQQDFAPEMRGDARVLLLANKVDLGLHPSVPKTAIPISAKLGKGLELLEEHLERALLGSASGPSQGQSLLAVNSRQSAALQQAESALEKAHVNGLAGLGLELISIDLKDALHAMSDVIGETTSEDVLARLFKNFCIGK